MRTLVLILVILVVALGGTFYVASEKSGEVVKLRTSDETGRSYETSLWIVEDGPTLWIRAGSPTRHWYQRLQKTPRVELDWRGKTTPYLASPEAASTGRVNALLKQSYGWAFDLISLFSDPQLAVAVRLSPIME